MESLAWQKDSEGQSSQRQAKINSTATWGLGQCLPGVRNLQNSTDKNMQAFSTTAEYWSCQLPTCHHWILCCPLGLWPRRLSLLSGVIMSFPVHWLCVLQCVLNIQRPILEETSDSHLNGLCLLHVILSMARIILTGLCHTRYASVSSLNQIKAMTCILKWGLRQTQGGSRHPSAAQFSKPGTCTITTPGHTYLTG